MKNVLKKLLLVVAIPVSLVAVLYVYLLDVPGCMVCDPVHRGRDDSSKTKPNTQPAQPDTRPPVVCDPVHIPPPKSQDEK